MQKECVQCQLKQFDKLSNFYHLNENQKETVYQEIIEYFNHVDMTKTNPEAMGNILKLMAKYSNINDPFKEIKSYYNQELMKLEDSLIDVIENSDDKLTTALKISIVGNLIDFGTSHEFDNQLLMSMINNILNTSLAVDDSESLFENLKDSSALLYLGDNCGEIVLDKIFIKYLKQYYPNLNITFVVRGKTALNDITLEDAKEVGIDKLVTVVDNGDNSPGTVIENTSTEFQNLFNTSDVVIAKGHGNYESLFQQMRNNLFFMFMAKCKIVADPLNIKIKSIVCLKSRINPDNFI